MPENSYTLHVVERDGTPVADLGKESSLTSLEWVLNDMGQAEVSISQDSPKVTAPLLAENELLVSINDGSFFWQGPWVKCQNVYSEARFVANTLHWYLTRRMIDTTSLEYSSIDQFSIAWGLIDWTQTGTDRDLSIDSFAFSASGKDRYRLYLKDQHQIILDLLQEFPELDDGFDWDFVIFSDGRREWTPYYPSQGTLRGELRLEYQDGGGRMIQNFSVQEDAGQIANNVYMTGGSNGEVKFEDNYTDTTSRAKYGLMQSVVSDGAEQDVAWLLEGATKQVDRYKDPLVVPELETIDVPSQLLGVLGVGDTIPVIISRGRVSINSVQRVQRIKWTPGPDKLSITVLPV